MRKLLLIGALVLIAASVFAEDAPKNYEIYGSTFFDYQLSGTELAYAQLGLSDFTFSKLRIGLRAQLADGVKSTFEFDPRNGEFRHAFIDWTPVTNLTITLGKTFTNFEQIVAYYGAGREYLAGVKYAVPGLGWAGLQIANKSDISFISGNYLVFPPLASQNPDPTAAHQTETLKFQQDPNFNFYPAVVFKPDLGKDYSLEVGLEGKLVPQSMLLDSPNGLSWDAYFTVSGFGFTFTNEFAWIDINDVADNQELTYYAQLTYKTGIIAPTVYFVRDSKKVSGYNAAIGLEFPIQVAANLKINPLFSYAIDGYNAFEGSNAIVDKIYRLNDWTAGIRFDYSYSIKF